MTAEEPRPSAFRRVGVPLIKLTVAALLLGLLFQKIPWSDRATLVALDGTERTIVIEPDTAPPPGARSWSGVGEDEGWILRAGDPATLEVTELVHPEGESDSIWASSTAKLDLGLRGRLERLSAGAFTIACLLGLAWQATVSLRWKLLLGALGLRVKFLRALRLSLAGVASNQVLLGSVGGDVVKAALVARDEDVPATLQSKTQAVFALVMDRGIGLVSLLAIGTVAALARAGTHDGLALRFGIALGVPLVGLVLVLAWARRREPKDASSTVGGILSSVHHALRSYRQRPGVLAVAAILSLFSHTFFICAVAWLGNALGMSLPWFRYFQISPIIETLQAVPISPAGWGVAETLYLVLYEEAGESAVSALSLALSVRAVVLALAVIGVPGLVLLLRRGRVGTGQSGG
jgi:uncharacterized membrane protein YbhN (UPF0104 family)